MNLDAIVHAIDAEIDRLSKARALLTGHTAQVKRGAAPGRKQQDDEFGRTSKGRRGGKGKMG
jgi:hypothetical protein